MVIEWLKKLSGGNTGKPRDNGTDRNAVIQRVVAGAAADTAKMRVEPEPTASTASTATAEPAPTRKPDSAPPPAADMYIPRDKVAQRAYEIWVRKGKPFGTSDHDWLQAEAEVRAELATRPGGEPLPNKPR